MPNEREIIDMAEAVLRERFGIDPAGVRESEDAWRFVVAGRTIEAVVHYVDFRVGISLCAMDGGVDIDAVYAELGATAPLGHARVSESDNYLRVSAKLPHALVTADAIEQAIRDCVALADEPRTHALTGKWQRW